MHRGGCAYPGGDGDMGGGGHDGSGLVQGDQGMLRREGQAARDCTGLQVVRAQAEALAIKAQQWIAGAPQQELSSVKERRWQGAAMGRQDEWGVRHAYRICTHLAPASFFQAAATSGITLFEPFGGLCAGLEMALRNGFKVQSYIYSDIDPAARQVAAFRVQALAQRYPGQLATLALQDIGIGIGIVTSARPLADVMQRRMLVQPPTWSLSCECTSQNQARYQGCTPPA